MYSFGVPMLVSSVVALGLSKQQRLALSAGTNACALSLEAALFALLLQKDLPFALACVIIISVSHGAALALCTAFYALVLVSVTADAL